MKLLITGAAGQLGTDLVRLCRNNGDDLVARSRSELDITDRDAVRSLIRAEAPDSIINCAAWTEVDDCESDPDRAHMINGTAVSCIAAAASDVGAHLVQVSTDYVFDGTKDSPYEVDDAPNPQSVYGASKLSGEQAALAIDASVVRTAWLFSQHGGNMVATILRLAQSHEVLHFVSDQRGNPTFTAHLAVALRNVARDRNPGLFHVTNDTATTWHGFAQTVFRIAGLDPARVKATATADLEPARPAPRPANSTLANSRYTDLGYSELCSFEEALVEVVPAYL